MQRIAGDFTVAPSLATPAELTRVQLEQARDTFDADPFVADQFLDRVNVFLAQRAAADAASQAVTTRARPPGGGLPPWRLRRVRDHIEQNIAEAITIARLATITGLSASHFCRAFKASMGETAHQYIMRRRVHHAQAMILQGDALCQVAVACGLSDQAHLSRVFKRYTGQTPKTWRRVFRAA